MDGLSRVAVRWRARAAARLPAARVTVAALAAVTVTALMAQSPAEPSGTPGSGGVLTAGGSVAITLTSAGTNGTGGTLPSGYPRVAEDGRYVAFQSESALKDTASVPQTPVPHATAPPSTPPPAIAPPSTPPPSTPPPGTSAGIRPAAGTPGTEAAPGTRMSLTAKTSPAPRVSRIYVRDETGRTTTLASDAKAGDAVAPDISANGKLVSYELGSDGADNVYVTDRQATGTGAFDTPANLRVRQITGTSGDLTDERIPACPAVPSAATPRTVPCGPRISADGTTLVYAAQQTPASPALRIAWISGGTETAANLNGNMLDFVPEADRGGAYNVTISPQLLRYTVTGTSPVTFKNPVATTSGPFSIDQSLTSCTGTLNPGGNCDVAVSFTGGATGCGTDDPVLVTGSLTTDATTPAGQSTLELAAYCRQAFSEAYRRPGDGSGAVTGSLTRVTSRPAGGAGSPASITGSLTSLNRVRSRISPDQAPAQCPSPPANVPYYQAPTSTATDNQGLPLTSLGDVTVGRPRVVWTTFTNTTPGTPGIFRFSGSSCGIQLIDPGSHAVKGQPAPCRSYQPPSLSYTVLGGPDPPSCTAYFLIDPSTVGTDVATFGMPFLLRSQAPYLPQTDYVAVNGTRSLVIARHDATGKGDFATSPSTVVSVDGGGNPIPGASQPSVSSTGRYVAFTAPVPAGQPGAQPGSGTEVWLHDTDARGNRTYKPGSTSVASCLPGSGACRHAPTADSPSLSGDGQTVAFTAGDQVEVRNVHADRTVVASAGLAGTDGNGPSYAPALSGDASTVAYVSEATNLTGASRSRPLGVPSLYVRQLLSGSGGNELAGPAATAARGAGGSGLPAIDAHGRLVAFQTADQLTASAVSGVENVYTAERFPHLEATPGTAGFGAVPRGSRARTVTTRISNAGPGPATVTGVHVTGPFRLPSQSCTGTVLHAGAGCTATVSFTPGSLPGHFTGTLVVTTADDGEQPVGFAVGATATVTAPALTMSPPVDVPGQVTQVQGTGFPAAAAITLTWNPGLGTVTVASDSAGRFTAAMLIFPDDVAGPRQLVAKAGGKVLATAPFLVDPPPAEPPFTQPPGVLPSVQPSGGSPSAQPPGGSQPTPSP